MLRGEVKMLFYDFEVFEKDWLVVIKDTKTRTTTNIVNDAEKLRRFHGKHVKDIWCGYNSRQYDRWILKAIILGFNPKELNDWIIVQKKQAWQFSSLLNKIPLINYDCMNSFHGLKQLEGFMGHDIRETTVPFDIKRKLTDKEIEEVLFYCNHDVKETMEVFMRTQSEFKAHIGLVKAFNLDMNQINKTKTQLSAYILGAEQKKRKFDEFDIKIVDTIKLNKYKFIQKFYEDSRDEVAEKYYKKFAYDVEAKKAYYKSKVLNLDILGVPHSFGWGGLHGAVPNYFGEGFFVNSDVGSFYPSLMIAYALLSRNVKNPNKYSEIYEYRMKLKKAGKKTEQQPYKIVLNATFGGSKDQYNPLFDPRQANNVCINGQLMLLDLIEKVHEALPSAKLIQSNTDGVMWKLSSKNDFAKYKSVCDEWCNRTKMTLDHDTIKKVIQKDVNNYIIVMDNDKIKSKGAYVKSLNDLDYDLPIINKALTEYLLNGVSVERTILECDDLIQFQKICKVSSKYKCALHGDKVLSEKVLRVFASKNSYDDGVFKIKLGKDKKEKVAGTPIHCFIDNSDVREKKIPRYLDRNWYIAETKKRISKFRGTK